MNQNGEVNSTARSQRLKIAHIASGDLWAGAEVQLFNLVVETQKIGFVELCVCLLNHGKLHDELRSAGINVVVFDEHTKGILSIASSLYQMLRRFKPDVVHTHRLKENVLGSIVTLFFKNTVSVRTVHGAPEHKYGLSKLHKLALAKVDQLCGRYLQKAVFAVSAELKEQLHPTFPASKVQVALNGIDCALIQKRAAEPLNELPGAAADTKICFAGRLAPVKRLDLWVEIAAMLLQQKYNSFAFYIIGDGSEKKTLQALIEKLGVEAHVHLMGEQDNVPALLKKMDVFMLTSDHEGVPMVILEALCVKTLVVAHKVGGISSLLDNGDAGYLVDRHCVEGYTDSILNAINNPSAAGQKEANGFVRVNTIYSARECASTYIYSYPLSTQIAPTTRISGN